MRTQIDVDLVEQLRKVYIFAEVSPKHLAKIAAQGKVVHHAPGHEIMTEGRSAIAFHLFLDGEADILVHGEVRRTLGPGDYAGEIALIDGKPRSASVVARTDVKAWVITAFEFKAMLENEPGLAFAVLRGLCARVREAEAIPAQT